MMLDTITLSLHGMASFSGVFGLSIVIFSASILSLAALLIYRLTLHPLAKYPGPFLWKLSNWPITYHAWKGDSHLVLYHLHNKYGKFVRFGPNRVSVNSNTALWSIYGTKANTQKATDLKTFPLVAGAFSLHSSIDREVHARKRALVRPGFSDASMRKIQPLILEITSNLAQQLSKSSTKKVVSGWGEPKDMSKTSTHFTFDVMGIATFGKSFRMLEDKKDRWVAQAIGITGHHKYTVGMMQWVYNTGVDKLFLRNMTSIRARLKKFSVGQLTERLERGKGEHNDFIEYFSSSTDKETGATFSQQELGSEAALMIAAGSDTSSTTLAGSFFYLIHNTSALSRVTAEVRSKFTSIDDIQVSTALNSCTYLRAVMDESMRLSPPIPGILLREVLPGGLFVDTECFAAGTNVTVPSYTVMRNPSYYPSPSSFKPERWIAGEKFNGNIVTKESVELAHTAFCPFSLGPRGCIGKGMAYMELTLALARILWLFDMRLAPGTEAVGCDLDGNYALRDHFVAGKEGPFVQFKARS